MKFSLSLFLMFLLLFIVPINSFAEQITKTIQTKYTWPRTQNKAMECDLAELGAENKATSFSYKVGKINVISIEVDDCECKKGRDKLWGCRATATISYWNVPKGEGVESEVKISLLKKYTEHIFPSKQKILSPLLKLNKMNNVSAILKGTRVLKYIKSYQKMVNRVGDAKGILTAYQSKGLNSFEKETDKLLSQFDRNYNKMQKLSGNFTKLERQIIKGDSSAINELKQQKENGFNAKKCIKSITKNGESNLTNNCNSPVWVMFCTNSGKKQCGATSRFYTHSEKLKYRQSYNNQFSLPPGADVKYGACYVKKAAKYKKDGSYVCSNPY